MRKNKWKVNYTPKVLLRGLNSGAVFSSGILKLDIWLKSAILLSQASSHPIMGYVFGLDYR